MTDQETFEEAYQEGYEKGLQDGQTDEYEDAHTAGYEEGYEKGYEAGQQAKDEQEWEPDNNIMLEALEECKTAFEKLNATAEGDNSFLWALSELMKHIASVAWPSEERPF